MTETVGVDPDKIFDDAKKVQLEKRWQGAVRNEESGALANSMMDAVRSVQQEEQAKVQANKTTK